MSECVLVADDHPMCRAALRHVIGTLLPDWAVHDVDSQATLEDAVLSGMPFGLAIIDLVMPGSVGFSSLTHLRRERPALPVVVASSNEHPSTIHHARQFGASAFVPKSAPVVALEAAVRNVLAGSEWFPAEIPQSGELDSRMADRLAQLTPQQLRVLMCLADGLLNKQVAWELGLAENTVKIHVTAILRKLGCQSRTQAAVLVKTLPMRG